MALLLLAFMAWLLATGKFDDWLNLALTEQSGGASGSW